MARFNPQEPPQADMGLAEVKQDGDTASPPSPAEKISLFLSLFRCRADVYPKLWENPKSGKKGYSPVASAT